jgi:uncharacterized protein YqjF (DUF2071 family)
VRAIVTQALDALTAPFTHARVTRVRDHRPWPMPRRPWVMGQTWRDLLFAHWDVTPATLRRAVPAQLELDTFDDRAWIAVTPFIVRNLRVRLTLPLPGVSAFPEINVRTYVTVDDRPGIYFFSLDAGSALAVAAARTAYRLPYFRAEMSARSDGGAVSYASRRVGEEPPAPAAFRAAYRPVGESFRARPGSLEHWLTERYCLYTLDDQAEPQRAEIHHPPWPLQPAAAEIETNTMGAEVGLDLAGQPLLHYARRQDVVFWGLERAQRRP